MPNLTNEDARPVRLMWLPGIALGAVCALLVWPQTHRLVASQLRLTIPIHYSVAAASPCAFVDSTISDYTWPIVRKTAADHPEDLSIQIAAALTLPPDTGERDPKPTPGGMQISSALKVERLQKLIPRFTDQPALYATVLRLYTMGKVRCTRDEVRLFLPEAGERAPTPYKADSHSQLADVDTFNSVCEAGERLDPENAYFPIIHSIGLFESHRDGEALAAIERAAACSHWMEYLDTELDGEVNLQTAAFGPVGPMTRATFGAAILLPHLASIKFATELALFEAMQDEQSGHITEGLRIRTAVRHFGSIMRSDSRNLIGSLVGCAIVKMSLLRPLGAPANAKVDVFVQKDAREALLSNFDSYLAAAGRIENSESVHAEVEACVKARSIIKGGVERSVFDTDLTTVLQYSMVDMIVLSTVVWVAALAGLVSLLYFISGSKPMRKVSRGYRGALMLILTLVAGALTAAVLIQQSEGSVGTIAQLGKIWWNLSDIDKNINFRAVQILSEGYLGIIAVVPVVTVMVLVGLCLIWKAPVVAGVTRGIRGCGVQICSALVIGYSILAPITSTYENRLDIRLTEALAHEGRVTAKMIGTEWPGIIK